MQHETTTTVQEIENHESIQQIETMTQQLQHETSMDQEKILCKEIDCILVDLNSIE